MSYRRKRRERRQRLARQEYRQLEYLQKGHLALRHIERDLTRCEKCGLPIYLKNTKMSAVADMIMGHNDEACVAVQLLQRASDDGHKIFSLLDLGAARYVNPGVANFAHMYDDDFRSTKNVSAQICNYDPRVVMNGVRGINPPFTDAMRLSCDEIYDELVAASGEELIFKVEVKTGMVRCTYVVMHAHLAAILDIVIKSHDVSTIDKFMEKLQMYSLALRDDNVE